jgi:hypothetical protein
MGIPAKLATHEIARSRKRNRGRYHVTSGRLSFAQMPGIATIATSRAR